LLCGAVISKQDVEIIKDRKLNWSPLHFSSVLLQTLSTDNNRPSQFFVAISALEYLLPKVF